MNIQNIKGFFDRHPTLTTRVAAMLTLLGIGLVRKELELSAEYDARGLERPGIYPEKDVEDTGEYIDPDEDFKVTRDDKSCIGKHMRFIMRAEVKEPEKSKGKQAALVPNLSQGYLAYCLLVSDQISIPYGSMDFYEVDGIISGHYITSGNRYLNCPIVKAVDIRRVESDEALERMFPPRRTVEPSVSATEAGVTMTLERIEYCDDVTRYFLRIENDSDYFLNVRSTVYNDRGEELYSPSLKGVVPSSEEIWVGIVLNGISEYYIWDPGETQTFYCATNPIGEDESVEIRVKISGFKYNTENYGLSEDKPEWELSLVYSPAAGKNGEGAAAEDAADRAKAPDETL